jgi:hypothetical protein
MSTRWPNKPDAVNPAIALRFAVEGQWCRVTDLERFGNMTTPQQFLRSFLREKAAAYAGVNELLEDVHAKYFGEPLSKHSSAFLMHDKGDA